MTPVLVVMIGLGGAAGAYARFRLSGWVYVRAGTGFPWGTLAVNLAGSFALGLLLPLLDARAVEPGIRALVMVGCIGAFTTFSTFAYEAVMLMRQAQRLRAAVYVACSIGLGLLAIVAGFALSALSL
jgi:fluoride exporter